MAPKTANKGTKRPAPKTNPLKLAKEAKKPQVDPMLQDVCAVIVTSDVPENCRKMLLAIAPLAFSSFASDRSEIQHAAVRMCGELVASAQERLSNEVREADELIATHIAAGSGLQAAKDAANASREEAALHLASMTSARSEALAVQLEADNVAATAKEVQKNGDADLDGVRAKLVVLKKGLEVDLPTLRNGPEGDAKQPVTYATLDPLLVLLSVDNSLVTALASTCGKKPEDFGPFDKMVVEQVEASAREKSQELLSMVAALEPSSEERAVVVSSAVAVANEKSELHAAASEKADAARASEEVAVASLRAAEEAIVRHEPELKAAEGTRADRQMWLQHFVMHQVASFEALNNKERPQTQPTVVPDASEPPASTAPAKAEPTPADSPDSEKPVEPQSITMPDAKVAIDIEMPSVEVAIAGA